MKTFTIKPKLAPIAKEVFYDEAYVLPKNLAEILVGKTLEIIEAIGLPERQEESVKNLVRKAIYNDFYDHSIYIANSLHAAICEARNKIKKDAVERIVPARGVELSDLK